MARTIRIGMAAGLLVGVVALAAPALGANPTKGARYVGQFTHGLSKGARHVGSTTVWSMKGHFISSRRASAMLDLNSICDAGGGRVTLLRQ